MRVRAKGLRLKIYLDLYTTGCSQTHLRLDQKNITVIVIEFGSGFSCTILTVQIVSIN